MVETIRCAADFEIAKLAAISRIVRLVRSAAHAIKMRGSSELDAVLLIQRHRPGLQALLVFAVLALQRLDLRCQRTPRRAHAVADADARHVDGGRSDGADRADGRGATNVCQDQRESWVVDGTLIPTRDHRRAARSKNYRWSCNAQVIIRRRDLRVIATTAGGGPATTTTRCTTVARASRRCASSMVASLPTAATGASPSWSHRCFARRSDPARPSMASTSSPTSEGRARHARLKNWRVLRDHRRRGCHVAVTLGAVAFLHNLHLDELRDNL